MTFGSAASQELDRRASPRCEQARRLVRRRPHRRLAVAGRWPPRGTELRSAAGPSRAARALQTVWLSGSDLLVGRWQARCDRVARRRHRSRAALSGAVRRPLGSGGRQRSAGRRSSARLCSRDARSSRRAPGPAWRLRWRACGRRRSTGLSRPRSVTLSSRIKPADRRAREGRRTRRSAIARSLST